MKRIILLFLLFCRCLTMQAQETFPVNGSQDIQPRRFAFTNATIVVSPSITIENGTLLIKEGIVEAVGRGINVPEGYLLHDLQGKFVYPAFIDAFSTYGMPDPPAASRSSRGNPVMKSTKRGPYGWNEAIHPEVQAQFYFAIDKREGETYRKKGFGMVQSLVRDGIARGSSMVVSLIDDTEENEAIVLQEAATHFSFDKGSAKTNYPRSLMGSIALLRQTYYDGQWYQQQHDLVNLSLQEFNRHQNLPQFFEASQLLDVLRAQKIGHEFEKHYIIKTVGDEYRRIDLLDRENARLIVPLDFPETYDVEDPVIARKVSLTQLKHWEMAPANPGMLEKAQIPFALTSYGTDSSKEFWRNLRKALDHGLSKDGALKALTIIPAKFLGISDKAGTLEKGKFANFIICSDSLFSRENILYENWTQGERFIVNKDPGVDIRGIYDTRIADIGEMVMEISGDPGHYSVSFNKTGTGTDEIKAKLERLGDLLNISLASKEAPGVIRISAYPSSTGPVKLEGEIVKANGETTSWEAQYVGGVKKGVDGKPTTETFEIGDLLYPFTAFGYQQEPSTESVVFKNGTVWTNEEDGVLENTDVWIQNGKIKAIGRDLTARGARVIDIQGKHLTPGIIDEHSHIAVTGGINEATQAVTAEVRIGDVINSEDINIYRQLAGGVTTSHILHGSANPIGGQSQLIKLRWGKGPEALKFGDNDGFIKFALGENVKQSNWGDAHKTRFPQSRMGVEQIYIDAFTRAKEYQRTRASDGSKVRRDLELEALVEILEGKRFITCHSYVQSEITMLMHVADHMGFKINTFTHILEGYKVADDMAKRKIAGSTFADWWAYKVEVAEAIPYNAYIMHERGVLTGINSDDAEMARRLNQEAAKAVKYGGLSDEAALKLVTLNPAKMLHIEDRVGSLKVGKDADVVVWSDHPLSVYAKAEMTFVDGVKYWDIGENEIRKEALVKEKARLIQKSIDSKKAGARTQKTVAPPEVTYHCESMEMVTID